jgi:proteasome lid subunit RPN8/RPN11
MPLLDFYTQHGNERVGFILGTGEIIEVQNVSASPRDSFVVRPEDILRYEDKISATFHTHPDTTSNLSDEDFQAFKDWPEFRHLIIGIDGVSCYHVAASGVVIKDEASDYSAWLPQEADPRVD